MILRKSVHCIATRTIPRSNPQPHQRVWRQRPAPIGRVFRAQNITVAFLEVIVALTAFGVDPAFAYSIAV